MPLQVVWGFLTSTVAQQPQSDCLTTTSNLRARWNPQTNRTVKRPCRIFLGGSTWFSQNISCLCTTWKKQQGSEIEFHQLQMTQLLRKHPDPYQLRKHKPQPLIVYPLSFWELTLQNTQHEWCLHVCWKGTWLRLKIYCKTVRTNHFRRTCCGNDGNFSYWRKACLPIDVLHSTVGLCNETTSSAMVTLLESPNLH